MKNIIENVNNNFKAQFFPQSNKINLAKIKVTTEGKYSISDNESSAKLIELIQKYFKTNHLIISDGTGNNGSDTIAMGLVFDKINSIELDDLNYKVLENNVKIYGLKNIDTYKGNSLDYFPKLQQDVIYIDAPWGGTNYKQYTRMDLEIGGKNLGQVYNEYKQYAKLFVFKIPKNYDFTNFIQTTMVTKYYIYLYIKNTKPKFFFMFVPCKK